MENRGDGQQIGLGSAHKDMDIHIIAVRQFSYGSGGSQGMGIQAVPLVLFQIGVHHCFQDPGMGTFTVVIFKAVHDKNPPVAVYFRRQ